MVSKSRYLERTQAGLCRVCGKTKAAEGGRSCTPCLEARRLYRRKLERGGLCIECKVPAVRFKKRCVRCLERMRVRRLNRARVRITQGLCPVCGAPKCPDNQHCLRHSLAKRAGHKRRYQECVANGICTDCHRTPAPLKSPWCEPCQEKRKFRYERYMRVPGRKEKASARYAKFVEDRRAKGICLSCDQPCGGDRTRCPDCRERDVIRNAIRRASQKKRRQAEQGALRPEPIGQGALKLARLIASQRSDAGTRTRTGTAQD